MNLSDIIKLAEAGFTAKQISAFAALQARVDTMNATETVQTEKTTPVSESTSTATVDDVLKRLNEMSIQMTAQPQKEQSVNDILAEIINPKEDKMNGG